MRPLLFLLIFGLTGFVLLAGLGVWQVQRMARKTAVLAEIEAGIAAAPGPLPAQPDPRAHRYLPVEIAGVMLPGEARVLVSTRTQGAGYRIIAPFRTRGGRLVLVDRGFVPAADHGRERTIGPMTITGNLHWPDEVDEYTPEPDRAANIWFARDVVRLAAELGTEPVLVIASDKNDPHVTPLPVDTAGIPNDHLQYAVTWFGLALVWAGMSVYFLRRRGRRNNA